MRQLLTPAGSVPRRSFLQLVAAAAGVKALEGIPLAGAIASISFDRSVAAAACAWRTTGTVKVNEVSLSEGGISFHQQISYDVAQQTGTLRASLTKGDALFFKIELAGKRGGALTGSASYGPDVHGVKNATIKSRDGKSFEGEMDGRALTARDRQVVFADGQPAPNITVEPTLRSALQALLADATKALTVCPTAPKPRTQPAPRTRGWIAPPGQDWYPPVVPGPACDACEQGCNDTYASNVDKGNFGGAMFHQLSVCGRCFRRVAGLLGTLSSARQCLPAQSVRDFHSASLAGLERQLRAFVQLPFRSLDDISLRERLRELGQGVEAS